MEYCNRSVDQRRRKSNTVSAANAPVVSSKSKTGAFSKNKMRVFKSAKACWIGFVCDLIAERPIIVIPNNECPNRRYVGL